ncbi:hypothetical protein PV327_004673 [Microctonus hyperodae]|uniref:phospholipase A1 n=1 Tax=Microctonus hyperodae TaxID=165561 RepID=A0AA39FD23_MICHY|nr:hypothetical protein PV327_004673 [Microctonus hyperodae]
MTLLKSRIKLRIGHTDFYLNYGKSQPDISCSEYNLCYDCQPNKIERDVTFYLHTRENPSIPYILKFKNEENLFKSPLNPYNQTIIVIHGFGESSLQLESSFSRTIRDVYLKRDIYNVILVDWRKLAAMPTYLTAARNVKKIAPYVARMVEWLINLNALSMPKIHIIGFSLGAQVAAFVAKNLAPQKVGRITGLDPAAPFFEHTTSSERLDKSDAIFVDVIHTNSKIPGMKSPIGHVDFYPNQGIDQPGCNFPDILCSHHRAWFYYAESVLNERGFPASKCQAWKPNINTCTKNPDAFMGFIANPQINGIFLLRTNSKSPFARNMTDYPAIIAANA